MPTSVATATEVVEKLVSFKAPGLDTNWPKMLRLWTWLSCLS